ncbi:hypothetical protein AK812_SmicGene6729 [Symbiodinium microadriaticum]|uniref:Uncharacterized protein n=1 Tax=Symbiodinium microadriaticum TaxID=2951 RepID=A0A1Q9EQC7_SYMMI|nr:hypothetical protein AK812_SmicGene6729 [Symbiodinium microadriaticum]
MATRSERVLPASDQVAGHIFGSTEALEVAKIQEIAAEAGAILYTEIADETSFSFPSTIVLFSAAPAQFVMWILQILGQVLEFYV